MSTQDLQSEKVAMVSLGQTRYHKRVEVVPGDPSEVHRTVVREPRHGKGKAGLLPTTVDKLETFRQGTQVLAQARKHTKRMTGSAGVARSRYG